MSAHEWLALMEAMALGLHESSLDGFYHLCRTLCVKDIALYDAYDEAFLAYFKDIHVRGPRADRAASGLADGSARRSSSSPPSSARSLKELDLEELREQFEQRLKEQKERHDGGNRWIGTGARPRSGPAASNPTGMRVGGGGGRSAMAVADERLFKRVPQATSCSTSARSTSRCAACGGSVARARSRSSISTRPSSKTGQATPASSRSCSGRRVATASRSCC